MHQNDEDLNPSFNSLRQSALGRKRSITVIKENDNSSSERGSFEKNPLRSQSSMQDQFNSNRGLNASAFENTFTTSKVGVRKSRKSRIQTKLSASGYSLMNELAELEGVFANKMPIAREIIPERVSVRVPKKSTMYPEQKYQSNIDSLNPYIKIKLNRNDVSARDPPRPQSKRQEIQEPTKKVKVPPLKIDRVVNRFAKHKFVYNVNNDVILDSSSKSSFVMSYSSQRSKSYRSHTQASELKQTSQREPSKEPVWNHSMKVDESVIMKGPPIFSSLIRKSNKPRVNSSLGQSNIVHGGPPSLPVSQQLKFNRNVNSSQGFAQPQRKSWGETLGSQKQNSAPQQDPIRSKKLVSLLKNDKEQESFEQKYLVGEQDAAKALSSDRDAESTMSLVLPLVTQVSQTLPEDELQNLINDLKKKRDQYLGESAHDQSARERLATRISQTPKNVEIPKFLDSPFPDSERGRTQDVVPPPVRIRSLSKPAVPKSKEQRRYENRKAVMKAFKNELPQFFRVIIEFLGKDHVSAYRFVRINNWIWNNVFIENFTQVIQERIQKTNFMRMLGQFPDLSKYKGNLIFKQNIRESWRQEHFGGPILNHKNNLKTLIEQESIHSEFDLGKGFYVLKNVRISPKLNIFWDIFILITEPFERYDLQCKFEFWHQQSIENLDKNNIFTPRRTKEFVSTLESVQNAVQSVQKLSFGNPRARQLEYINQNLYKTEKNPQNPKKKTEKIVLQTQLEKAQKYARNIKETKPGIKPQKSYINLSEIREGLNGYARIIEYNYASPTKDLSLSDLRYLSINFLNEGQYKSGLFEGFGRSFDSNGNCQIGYWKRANIMQMKGIQVQSTSRPYGKWANYAKDGSQVMKEGIYLGDDKKWNRIVQKKAIVDYYDNEQPKYTFGQMFSNFCFGVCICSQNNEKESSQNN